MNIQPLKARMLLLGLSEEQFDELAGLAGQLPRTKISGQVAGLTELDTSVLLSHVLRTVAPDLGVRFEHPNLIGELGFELNEPQAHYTAAAAAAAETASATEDQFHSAS